MKTSLAAVAVFALTAAACSQHAPDDGSTSGGDEHAATQKLGHLGDTLDLIRADGSKIAVTVTRVINPATVANGEDETDKTYIATEMTLADTGKTSIEGDVNANVSVIGSDNQVYGAELNDVTECANFDLGEFHLTPGHSATGCVVFALPHGVSPAKVRYSPSAGFAEDSGEWVLS